MLYHKGEAIAKVCLICGVEKQHVGRFEEYQTLRISDYRRQRLFLSPLLKFGEVDEGRCDGEGMK